MTTGRLGRRGREACKVQVPLPVAAVIMPRLNHFGLMVRCGFLGFAFLGLASAQTQWSRDSASITDLRPLLKATEILISRYGVPISYEDVSAYKYYADLADPVDYRAAHPDARILPPRGGSLSF